MRAQEKSNIALHTQRGRRARAEAGKLVPSPKPIYDYHWADEGKLRLVVDPETAPVIQRLYSEVLTGKPLRRIAADLTAEGVPTPKHGREWGRAGIARLVSRTEYAGRAYTFRIGRDSSTGLPLPDGVVPPLADLVTCEATQERLPKNKEQALRRCVNPEAVLLRGGFARCGLCGYTMYASSKEPKAPTYRCSKAPVAVGERCNHGVRVTILEETVWARLEAILTRPDIVEWRANSSGSAPRNLPSGI